jgi:Uma2 family endonuclease
MAHVALSEPARFGGRALPGQDELPSDDGEPLETGFHVAQNALLTDSLVDAWSERRDFFVGGNMFVYFSEKQVKANDFRGPDVFVVLEVEGEGRKSWVAWEEGGRLPDVVIEVTSESTAHTDRGEKMGIYAKVWRTPAYFIYDPEARVLEGYRLDGVHRDYVPIEPNERGDLPVAPLGLALGLRPTRYRHFDEPFVRWIDEHGEPLPTASERAERALARAEEERRRAEKALGRVEELEERLGRTKK